MRTWTEPKERLKPKNWRGEQATFKQHKLNGHRFTLYKQPDGKLVGWEREIRHDLEMTRKRPGIVEYDWWKALDEGMPPKSTVDGELYIVGGNAGDAAHAIAECDPRLEFGPFAVPWWDGMAIHTLDLMTVTHGYLQPRTGLRLVPFYFVRDALDTEEQLLADARDLGIEGWVLKNFNYLEWWKLKPTKTLDCVVTGFKDGNGKYLGLTGALRVSAWIDGKYKEVASVSGMTDEQRLDVDEKTDLGRVVEVEYQEVGNGGRLIHPRFVRWRDDKPADQCKYESEDL